MGEVAVAVSFDPSKQVGTTSLEPAGLRLRQRASRRTLRQGRRGRFARHAGRRLGRRRALLRYRALVWPRPLRAPARRLPAHQAARSNSRSPPRSGVRCTGPSDPTSFDRSPWTGGLNFEVHFDYSYDGIMRSYEQALQRLALDTVDALVIHDLDAAYHGDGFEQRTARARRKRHEGAAGAQGVAATSRPSAWASTHDEALERCRAARRSRFLPRRHALHAARPAEPPSRDGGAA